MSNKIIFQSGDMSLLSLLLYFVAYRFIIKENHNREWNFNEL